MSITCIHGLEAMACKHCKPVRPKPMPTKPKAKQPTKPRLSDAEAQHRLEQAILSAREAAHTGTLLSKQLGKKPNPVSAIRVVDRG